MQSSASSTGQSVSERVSEPLECRHFHLLLKRAALSRPSGQWNHDEYEVLAKGEVVAGHAKMCLRLR
jgi:hypothetical protein